MILKDDGSEDLMSNAMEKTIDENSKDLMFKVLQSHQYRYPVKSAIRETASNGVDSHNERDMAVAILTGAAKVSDYYDDVEKREDGMQHSSSFDPSYYDLNWLSDKQQTNITYIERNDENRDLIRFEDWGVGLGESRLEGYFQLAYSSKRKNKKLIGGWGLGAKAFLATDIDSFRVTSYYNGKKFVFDVYETTVNSVVPKFGDSGKNEIYTFPKSGYQCYYEDTDRKNGVMVEATVVKSQKYDYQRAVKTQLLYMTKVDFFIKHSWGSESKENFHAEVLYSDANILISSNSIQSKPHILMGDPELGTLINYGYVDFEALEMSQYYGSVGIIVSPEEVDISTSRENLLWKKKTREGIQTKFDLVKSTAEEYVKKKIKVAEDNLYSWLEASHNIIKSSKSVGYGSTSGDNVLSQLAKVVDIDEISFDKEGDSSKNFVYSPITKYFKSKENVLISRHITQGQVNTSYRDSVGVAKRTGVTDWSTLFSSELYLVTEGEKVTGAAIRYLMKTHGDQVVFINTKGYELNRKLEPFVEAALEAKKIRLFADLEIPEEELKNMDTLEQSVGLSVAEQRKLEGKIVLKEVYNSSYVENREFTRDEIETLKGVYGPHEAMESLKSLNSLLDAKIFVASEQALKMIEETDNELVYYRDAVFKVQDGEIEFNSIQINQFINQAVSSMVDTRININLDSDIFIKAKHLGYTNVTTIYEMYQEFTLIANNCSNHAYADLGYSQGNFYTELTAFIRDLTGAYIKDNEQSQLNLETKNYPSLPRSVKNVHTLSAFKDEIQDIKQFRRIRKIIHKNVAVLTAYNNRHITLEQLNSLIHTK